MQTLHTLRRSRKLTLLDVARLTGIPARTLAEAEYGLRSLSYQDQQQLAFVFGLSDTTLFAVPTTNTAPPLTLPARQAMVALALAGALALTTVRPPTRDLPRLNLSLPGPGVAPALVANRAPPVAAAFAPADVLRGRGGDQATGAVAALLNRSALPAATAAPLAPARAVPPAGPAARAVVARPPAQAPVLLAPPPAFVLSDRGPIGCPLQPAQGRVVLTQGYGVGTHAPASIWGAVDLAVDGNGDGYAEPAATFNTPIVATHAGIVAVTLDSWPGGNHVAVSDAASGWRTGYAHMSSVLVTNGQHVNAGQVIGLVGSTGYSTGPHVDYQVWHHGLNIDPTELVGACGLR